MNNRTNYEVPTLEVVELELEAPILGASTEDSIPEFGE